MPTSVSGTGNGKRKAVDMIHGEEEILKKDSIAAELYETVDQVMRIWTGIVKHA